MQLFFLEVPRRKVPLVGRMGVWSRLGRQGQGCRRAYFVASDRDAAKKLLKRAGISSEGLSLGTRCKGDT